MTTREAIEAVASQLTDEPLFCTTGFTCRDVQAVADRAQNFYMIGSMGVAPALGLGTALSQPDQRVVVFDGDGALLMGLGVLPMVASLAPKNLVHVVFDNGAFASTGGQPTYSREVALTALASASGYPVVREAHDLETLVSTWQEIAQMPGPIFLLVKCQLNSGTPSERIRLAPDAITKRFMGEVDEEKEAV